MIATSYLLRRALKRPPDFVIHGRQGVYLRRWWLVPRNQWFNIYLHQICEDDGLPYLHDHPWFNVSLVLRGSYIEHLPAGARCVRAGDVVFRRPSAAHRLTLDSGPVWTIFITGPRVRTWGFYTPAGWRPWYVVNTTPLPPDKISE